MNDDRANKWANTAIAFLTIAIMAAELANHNPKLHRLMVSGRDHLIYYGRRARFYFRHWNDEPWQEELRAHVSLP